MTNSKMIVVTGAAGFIGSCLIRRLNDDNYNDIIAVDDFSNPLKNKNIVSCSQNSVTQLSSCASVGKRIRKKVDRKQFFNWLKENNKQVEFIFHLGARTDTAEFDKKILDELNLNYSKKMWQACSDHQIPLVYASSAATYGMGELGYDDDESIIQKLKPLNPYGRSKNDFDIWVLEQKRWQNPPTWGGCPPFWAGLKLFNVYGPNEYHKDRMASVIFHTFNQISKTGKMKLFRSHNSQFKDGEQMRDFIYVKDVLEVCMFLMHNKVNVSSRVLGERFFSSGIYNLGTGQARTFIDLAKSTFKAMGKPENIQYIDIPEDIRDKYQYFTQANMQKLRSIGYDKPFYSLEDGVDEYVRNYLMLNKYL